MKDLNNLVGVDFAIAWRQLGEKLGVPSGTLSLLEKDHGTDGDHCYGEVFNHWLDNDPEALWSTMLKALDSPEVVGVKDFYTNPVAMVAKCLQEQSKQTRHDVIPDQWPKIKSEHFTSVKLVDYKRGHNRIKDRIKDTASIQHEGANDNDANDSHTRTFIGMSEIFAPMETTNNFPRIILIEGAPGIGKTTLCKEIVYQWSKNIY